MSNYSTLYKILSGLIDNVTNLNSKQEAETSLLLSANIGSTGSNTNVVEKLSAEFTPAESDLGKVYLWSVDDTTNMKKGHIYKVSSKEVTTTTESSGGSGVSFTISGMTTPAEMNGTYTEYGTTTYQSSGKYYTSYSNGTYYLAVATGFNYLILGLKSNPQSPGDSYFYSQFPTDSTYHGTYFSGTGTSDDPYKILETALSGTWSQIGNSALNISGTPTFSNYSSGGTTTTTTTSTEYYLEDITVIGSSTDDSNLSSQVNTNTSNISSLSASIGDINTALANILNE